MKKVLYVNGDSHSAGLAAGGPHYSYGNHIAKTLNMEFVCDAVAGCSNDSIIDRTNKYLEQHTPDLMIIGWSTWERETWEYEGNTYNVTASGTDTVHPALVDRYKQWVIDSCDSKFQQQKEEINYKKIWDLHTQLKEKNIKHVFFNCYSYFFYTTAFNKPRADWGINYINPYEKCGTYYFWLEKEGYVPAVPKFYHYGADAHKAWADFLIDYIKNNDIVH